MVKIKNEFEVKAIETTEGHYQQLQRPNKIVRSNHLNTYLELTKVPRCILKSRSRQGYYEIEINYQSGQSKSLDRTKSTTLDLNIAIDFSCLMPY